MSPAPSRARTHRPARTSAAILILVAAAYVLARAQVRLPDTPAARECAAWLDAFNSGDRDTYATFIQAHYPSDAPRIANGMMFRAQTGGLDLRKIEESTSTTLVALVQERLSDQFARLTVETEAAEPHHISRIGLQAITRPAEFPLPHLTEAELVRELRTKLDSEAAADRFAGAVMWTKQGKTVFSGAYGAADRERNARNTLNTRFRIGSMNKMFTATAALQLVETGKLKLDAPVGAYLTDYPNQQVATKVTIEQLLTHMGGTGDIFGPEFAAHRMDLRTLQDYVKLYGSRGPAYEPGSRWEYSNYGFILLGAVIERVSGESYYDYVREHVYRPAGMTATGSEPEDVAVADRSIGYTRMGNAGGAYRPNTDTLPYRGTSAGGGYSTVADLTRFARAVQQHTLLDARFTELLTTGKVETPAGRYAYGFGDRTINGARCFGHSGGAPGMNGDLEICPATGDVIVVLANVDPPAASRVSDFVTNRLPIPAAASVR